MSQEFLSQEEVDALLKGVTGESDEAPAAPKPATTLSKAAADDPVQSVFFTSFIIQ